MTSSLDSKYTNEYFQSYFVGTNFGSHEPLELVYEGLMKVVCGYSSGFTLETILHKLGYITWGDDRTLTNMGKHVLYSLYEQQARKI